MLKSTALVETKCVKLKSTVLTETKGVKVSCPCRWGLIIWCWVGHNNGNNVREVF